MIILYIILHITMPNTDNCIDIHSVNELRNILKTYSKRENDFDTCLNTNYAYIYYLSSGQIVMIPNENSERSNGLIFQNKKCLDECIKKDEFPLENEKKTLQEFFQADILNLTDSIDGIKNYLTELITNTSSQDLLLNSDLSRLLMELKLKIQKKELSKRDTFRSYLLLGEYVRSMYGGKWILLKRYGTFNPYYTPAILFNDNAVLPFWDYLNTYFQASISDPKTFANLPYIKNPVLKLNNPFFKNNYKGYIILN